LPPATVSVKAFNEIGPLVGGLLAVLAAGADVVIGEDSS